MRMGEKDLFYRMAPALVCTRLPSALASVISRPASIHLLLGYLFFVIVPTKKEEKRFYSPFWVVWKWPAAVGRCQELLTRLIMRLHIDLLAGLKYNIHRKKKNQRRLSPVGLSAQTACRARAANGFDESLRNRVSSFFGHEKYIIRRSACCAATASAESRNAYSFHVLYVPSNYIAWMLLCVYIAHEKSILHFAWPNRSCWGPQETHTTHLSGSYSLSPSLWVAFVLRESFGVTLRSSRAVLHVWSLWLGCVLYTHTHILYTYAGWPHWQIVEKKLSRLSLHALVCFFFLFS